MQSRKLILRTAALRDLARHEAFLREVRGADFAADWTDALLAWLEHRADLGAQFGTAHPAYPRYRTFGYRRQATILAEFTDDTMDIVRNPLRRRGLAQIGSPPGMRRLQPGG